MKMEFFCKKVIPLEIMPSSQFAPLLQFFSDPSIPEQSIMDKIRQAKKRKAQSLVFHRFTTPLPQNQPTVINKEHSTHFKASLFTEERLAAYFHPVGFGMGKTFAMGVRFPAPLPTTSSHFRMVFGDPDRDYNLLICQVSPQSIVVWHPREGVPPGNMRACAEIKWKEKFLCLKEILLVLKQFEGPDDSNRVSFEANLVVNHLLEHQLKFSFEKTRLSVAASRFVHPRIESVVLSNGGEGLSTFAFEVFDVKR